MQAVDADRSQTVYYRLRDASKEFSVNSTTGEVTVAFGLDRETKDSYTQVLFPLFELDQYAIVTISRLEVGATNEEDSRNEDVTVWMTLNVIVTDV